MKNDNSNGTMSFQSRIINERVISSKQMSVLKKSKNFVIEQQKLSFYFLIQVLYLSKFAKINYFFIFHS